MSELNWALCALGMVLLAWVVWIAVIILMLFETWPKRKPCYQPPMPAADKPAPRTVPASTFVVPDAAWVADVNRRVNAPLLGSRHKGVHRSPPAVADPYVFDQTLADVYRGRQVSVDG